jgi:hypothetical protein
VASANNPREVEDVAMDRKGGSLLREQCFGGNLRRAPRATVSRSEFGVLTGGPVR